MKRSLLRTIALSLLGVYTPLVYAALFSLAAFFRVPVKGDAGTGIALAFASLMLIGGIPLAIFLGNAFASSRRGAWVLHLIVLLGVIAWLVLGWGARPLRYSLFIVCALTTLPIRAWIEHLPDSQPASPTGP
ncbi:MAG: hypothetical protein JST66_10960 [Bacteroidetes bacterium]|nr:hypothetical protein [Bacteroidota bacterium]